VGHQLLDDGRPGDRQLFHLRRQLPDVVPDQHFRRMDPPLPRIRGADGVRGLLPEPLRTGQARRCDRAAGARLRVAAHRRPYRACRRGNMAVRSPALSEHGLMIEAVDLRKTFTVYRRAGRLRRERRQVTAVDGVSFLVEPGEMVGYIGPNGAGKSTTIKMLTGILVPSSGKVLVAGLAPA